MPSDVQSTRKSLWKTFHKSHEYISLIKFISWILAEFGSLTRNFFFAQILANLVNFDVKVFRPGDFDVKMFLPGDFNVSRIKLSEKFSPEFSILFDIKILRNFHKGFLWVPDEIKYQRWQNIMISDSLNADLFIEVRISEKSQPLMWALQYLGILLVFSSSFLLIYYP